MKYDELVSVINEMKIGDKFDFKSSSFVFGLECMELLENEVVVFGGYGTHFTVLDVNVYYPGDIAKAIVEHITQYDSEVSERITLDECELIRKK